MIIKYTQTQFDNAVSNTNTKNLLIECEFCHKDFLQSKNAILRVLKGEYPNSCKFCSCDCLYKSKVTKVEVLCSNCNKNTIKYLRDIKRNNNVFCSKSCSVTYNNTHKTNGTRISKLELWLQSKLSELYPNLSILYNDKTTINSELDIYIPSLNLAFELNGIFHYEPIYGPEKLNQIQNNDNRKFQACLEKSIELCIIDTSKQKRVTEKSSQEFLSIIVKLVSLKLRDRELDMQPASL